MKSKSGLFKTTCFVVMALLSLSLYANVKLPKLIGDSMILQRDAKINIWGWAAINEKVTVSFTGKKYRTITGLDGKWKVILDPVAAGGPYTMTIDAANHIRLTNILAGDVWLCSGQSNMVHQMELHKVRYAEEIVKASNPAIRQFWIPALANLSSPQTDLASGSWKAATPENVRQFSAVAYFFATTIYEKYHVPIGLINASVGGTPIEAWTSEKGLKEFPVVLTTIEKNKDTAYVNKINRIAFAYRASLPKPNDKGLNSTPAWFDTNYVAKRWRSIRIPGYWEDQGIKDLDGIVWYRKEITVPVSMIGLPAKVFLGRIVDADFLYLNGVAVGNTGYQYPQRRYALQAGLLKPGKNIFVVRVINNSGKGGFVPDKPYYLQAGDQTMDLSGEWSYKVGDVFTPAGNPLPQISLQNQPTALFNAMIAPATNYTIKGMLWYQGESNIDNASDYEKLLPVLIKDWRSQWKQGDVPFLYVQLPNFGDVRYLPSESNWAVLREGQLKTLSVLNTGMAVAIDLGEWNDIHPDNKKDVGVRLALAAQKVAYGENETVYSGPVYQSSKTAGNTITISFSNIGSGLMTNDNEEPKQFAIAGADKKFVWANAKIEGHTVIVWNNTIPDPMYVRYAWADNPADANLYNKEGLPASPFRTDK